MASEAILSRLQAEFDSPPQTLAAAVALLEEGAPPAFVARHRRWATGNMHEDRLHALADRLHFLTELEARKQAIAQQAQERGKLTEDLQRVLENSQDQDLIDDLYQAMRPRRRTPAVQMEEKGLSPLALAVQHRQLGEVSLQDAAKEYVSEANGLPTVESVLEGVALILSEQMSSCARTRARLREELARGVLRATAVNPGQGGNQKYQEFFDFAEPVNRIGANRMLAIRRAEREGILKVQLTLPENRHREILRELHGNGLEAGSALSDFMDVVFDHAWGQVLQEACSRDVRRRMKERADREAVRTFARNLRSQLLAPPLGAKKVLAVRSSSRTIWAALLGEDGSVAQHRTMTVNDDNERKAMLDWFCELVRTEQPAAVAVPHGRRQAGAEKLVAELRAALGETPMPMVIPVDEAASAIFATSTPGRKAIPGVEVGVRTAISLGRRLQDPLRELVQMDFRTLGLGQSLDDVHQGMLRRELGAVVGSCVAMVGTDLNTSGEAALAQVPGVSEELAAKIVEQRRKQGGFRSRAELANVPGLDEKMLRNIAGCLVLEGGSEPLDRTMLHPEDYPVARAIAEARGCPVDQLFGQELRDVDLDRFTGENVDRMHVLNVVQALRNVGKDPRGTLTATANVGVGRIEDLKADQELQGRVANLTEFGAFVDLGIGHDGLVHISQIPGHRMRNPDAMLRVGEVVTVWVLAVDQDTKKISLTMHQPRHLAEGRQPTIGERLEQGQRRGGPRRERRRREEEQPQQAAFSRAARTPESRKGRMRSSPLTPEGKPVNAKPAEGEGEELPVQDRGPRGDSRGGPRHGGRGRPDGRGPRSDSRGGPRDPRVFTIESEREVQETKGHKGEITSLGGLRALLQKNQPKDDAQG
ncbi:MAG: ribosomal protein [Planctomycetota bacterium]